jgi:uncharacterized protein (TIGR03083 family)
MSTDLRTIAPLANAVTTYQEAVADIHAILNTLSPEQWNMATPCPGWTVADIAAHVIDIETMAAGEPKADHTPDWDALPHVKSPSQQFTELGVDYRRGTTPEILLRNITESSANLLNYLADQPPIIKMPWSKSELSQDQFLLLRSFDIWVHEQDIRSAINSPGDLATNPARNAAHRMINSLPVIWGKKVGAPPGSELHFTLTGPGIEGSANIGVTWEGQAEFVDQVSDSATKVSMSWPGFFNAFAGRQSQSIAQPKSHGDLAEEFITQLVSTP